MPLASAQSARFSSVVVPAWIQKTAPQPPEAREGLGAGDVDGLGGIAVLSQLDRTRLEKT